ncbi:DUF4348 domain-containing protein [Phocaeicola sp.]
MRKLIIGVCLLMLISSCGGGKKNMNPFETLTEEIDSITAVSDTATAITEMVEEPMVPATADESFADFIYNFAIDKKLQVSRIVFPLPYYTMDKKEHIEKDHWKHDPLFSQLDSYTVLFDKATDMEMEKDTNSTSVKVEWIYLKTNKMKRYYFERLQGLWKLEAIDFADMPKSESKQEDFFEFYERFANDSVFQQSRLNDPLKFVTVDPDDEFQILETTLETGQWFAFQPVLPREFLTNVNYGQGENINSRTKVIEIKGFGNGFNNTLYFERRKGLWKLVQFEDLSD